MIEAAVVALVVAALLVLPGAALAKAAGLPGASALAAGPAVTLGVVGFATLWLGFTPIRWNLVAASAVFLLLWAAAAYRGRVWPPVEPAEPMSRRSAATIGSGVAIGAGIFSYTCLRWMQLRTSRGFDNISQVWDALWHANLIRFIAETGVASPIRTGELINSDNHDGHFYPDAWHALVALGEPAAALLGVRSGYPQLYNIASVITPAVVLPISAAALTWQLARGKLGERWAAYGASAAAAGSALFPSLYEEEAFGSVPSAVAIALAPVVAVLAMSCVRDRSRLPVAVLALAGVTAAHPSATVVVAALLMLWWATQLLWSPVATRLKDFATLAAIPAGAGALLAPMALGLRSASNETDAFPFYWYDLTLTHAQAALRTAGLVSRTADESAPFEHRAHLMLPLLAVAAAGLLAALWLRQWWAPVLWALFVVVATNDLVPFGPGVCHPYPQCGPLPLHPDGRPSSDWPSFTVPWFLDKASGSFYHDPHRLAEVLTLLVTGFFGFGVAAALCCAERLLRPAAFARRWAAPSAFGLVMALILGYGHHMRLERGALASSSRNDWLVGPEDVKAYHWLAARPDVNGTVVLNQLEQGTGWMYAEAGLKPMFAHYRSPSFSADQACVYWFAASAGRDWRVADALRRLRVRYALQSPPNYWPDHPDPFVHLIDAPGVLPVYHDGPVTIYEFRDLAVRHDQEDPVVSNDQNHFCKG
ncbi:DUF6541 family protein [Segniliparus rugosus]|uniref:Uncharacterized protein n=1 Tax=Segniliparus rugosus (strain ATCC BAA-974 / DSM 45345 / CCUG 50838 / CIP 108380 / JCM 13579 / CDC 945) TaxID=679197 RepID=E5XNA3_SEGRC|nr:DUF6541 family protein [Segniliparus rugosus]EFV14163.2 hypothetical protein HMPREF9336_00973 [Segniliparus rugosus ATCC BAA-974]